MPKFRVRYNIECWLDVEASDKETAEDIADETPEEDFHRDLSGFDTEELNEEEI